MAVNSPSRRRAAHPALALVSTATAPLLWFTHLAVMYALVPLSCRVGSDAPLHLTTVLALGGLVVSAVVAVRHTPERSPRALLTQLLGVTGPPAEQDRSVPVLVTAALGVYFLGVAAMSGVVPLVVNRCA